ncbi:electron transfer flavoprotein beta subunit [Arcanobacterium wilhelmae]|uniref:Electron transfer flavoprotein beta subunit n=1 Tax=Arcanobacterium wilhelmae TaxID=1803177 RepID=A0ABT9NAL6_9ACTO|nr:electron transfer flavoprotein beta subunit/FixA family protein [Arcanobacterium wilhelmae]MDP9800754.1 electron transfer flavoprotein beta subunit [Arcanobacterium wilhelmae]
MTVIVAYKYASNPQEATVGADGVVDWLRAKAAVSDYDPVAITLARQLAAEVGTEVVGVSVGTTAVSSSLAKKNALSRGLDRALVVADDDVATWNTTTVASAIAELAKQIGDAEILITGDSSVDNVARMTSALVAGYLGWPCFQEVDSVTKDGDSFVLKQRIDGGTRTLKVAGPIVVGATSDAVVAPVPSMKDILAAGKKPLEAAQLADLAVHRAELTIAGRSKPVSKARKNVLLKGENAAAELVAALRADNVL